MRGRITRIAAAATLATAGALAGFAPPAAAAGSASGPAVPAGVTVAAPGWVYRSTHITRAVCESYGRSMLLTFPGLYGAYLCETEGHGLWQLYLYRLF
jgi:hypothetical protein